MTERDLQRLLSETAAATTYPETLDLMAPVLARIATLSPERRTAPRFVLSPALVVAVLLLVLAATLLVPSSRHAIARFFGVEGSRIERLPEGATLPSGRTEVSGTPVAPSELSRRAGFEVALPSGAGELRSAEVERYSGQTVLVLHYDQFDLWQTQMKQLATFSKVVPADGILRDVMVGSAEARWIQGEHYVYYEDGAGRIIQPSQRSVTRNTLVWRTTRAFYRIETDLSLDQTLQIARTLP